MIYIIIAALVIIVLLAALFRNKDTEFFQDLFYPEKRAGKIGELEATQIIQGVLNDRDHLFTNVEIAFDGSTTELDNVIVNNRGVFIVEVKNYSGQLRGSEDDYEWEKVHISSGGNAYYKTVKNPFKQVKREVYILASYLRYYGIDVWVEGYVFFVNSNSPIVSGLLLVDDLDIDKVVHKGRNNNLNQKDVFAIMKLLDNGK